MNVFGRRFARLRMRLAQNLQQSAQRHPAPQPRGRDAWLAGARSIDDLWGAVRSPLWAVHLAYLLECPGRAIMDTGTQAFGAAIDGYEDELPTLLDYGTLVPQERTIGTYLDWTDQPLEDLGEGRARYQEAAEEEFARAAAAGVQSASSRPASPYRTPSSVSEDASPRLHLLVAATYWFRAAEHASQPEPRTWSMCEALGVSLAHAFSARPSRGDELLGAFAQNLRNAGG